VFQRQRHRVITTTKLALSTTGNSNDRANRGGDITGFLTYAVQGFRDGLREQIDAIRVQHIEVAWVNYVHESFQGLDGEVDRRRRRLILELSSMERAWVGVDELLTISGKVARDYFGRGAKTLQRDLEKLQEMTLIERDGRRVRANKTAILAFLPARAQQPTAEDSAAPELWTRKAN